MKTYGTMTEALVLGSVFTLAMSSKRLSTSGKKSSLGKYSSESGASVTKKSVVARSAPLLPYKTQRGAVSEAYCPDSRCTPLMGIVAEF